MKDKTTTIEDLKQLVQQCMEERDWVQFHTPKNMAQNIAIEAAELMELFLWVDGKESYETMEKKRDAIEQEVADVGISLLTFCQENNIDFVSAFERKLELTKQKYPIEKCKGKNLKYTEL